MFLVDWEVSTNPENCHQGLVKLLGKCSLPDLVADVSELLFPFESVEAELTSSKDPTLWCWPVKWVIDAIQEYLFYVEKGSIVSAQMYDKFDEFGISSLTGDLKVRNSSFFIFV
jgi:hypothetical protein